MLTVGQSLNLLAIIRPFMQVKFLDWCGKIFSESSSNFIFFKQVSFFFQ